MDLIMKTTLNRRNLPTFFLILLFTITALSVVNLSLFELFTKVSLYAVLLVVLIDIITCPRAEKYDFILVMTSAAYFLLSAIWHNGGIGSVLNYTLALLILRTIENAHFTEKQFLYMGKLSIIMNIYIFLRSFQYTNNWVYYRFHDINPNTYGMFNMFFSMIVCNVFVSKDKGRKFVDCCARILSGFLSITSMINLKSRGPLMALLLFLLLSIMPTALKNGKSLYRIGIIFFAISIAFPFVYLNMYNNGINITILGKTLYTGREYLWTQMINALDDSHGGWILGMGSKVQLHTEQTINNVHNDPFVTIITFGAIGMILTALYILLKLKHACGFWHDTESSQWVVMYICSVFVLGFIETVSHWAVIYIFSYMGLGIACSIRNRKKMEASNDT